MMIKIEIPTKDRIESNLWWQNFFQSAGDWREAERILNETYQAQIVLAPAPELRIGSIIFEHDPAATMFMMKWS
jgi:hypothetical protein